MPNKAKNQTAQIINFSDYTAARYFKPRTTTASKDPAAKQSDVSRRAIALQAPARNTGFRAGDLVCLADGSKGFVMPACQPEKVTVTVNGVRRVVPADQLQHAKGNPA